MTWIIGILITAGAVSDAVINGFYAIHIFMVLAGVIVLASGSRLFDRKRYLRWAVPVVCLALYILSAQLILTPHTQLQSAMDKVSEYENSKYYAKAYQTLQDLLDKDPGNTMARNRLGMLFLAQSRYQEAANSFHEILSTAPADPEARYGLVLCHLAAKDWTKAINEASQILRYNPAYAPAYEKLGEIYWSLGDMTRGIYYLNRAKREDPGLVSAYIKLSEIYEKTHSYSDALSELENAIRQADTEKEARDAEAALKRLEKSSPLFPALLFQDISKMDAVQTSIELQYGLQLLKDGRYYPKDRISVLEAALLEKQDAGLKDLKTRLEETLKGESSEEGGKLYTACMEDIDLLAGYYSDYKNAAGKDRNEAARHIKDYAKGLNSLAENLVRQTGVPYGNEVMAAYALEQYVSDAEDMGNNLKTASPPEGTEQLYTFWQIIKDEKWEDLNTEQLRSLEKGDQIEVMVKKGFLFIPGEKMTVSRESLTDAANTAARRQQLTMLAESVGGMAGQAAESLKRVIPQLPDSPQGSDAKAKLASTANRLESFRKEIKLAQRNSTLRIAGEFAAAFIQSGAGSSGKPGSYAAAASALYRLKAQAAQAAQSAKNATSPQEQEKFKQQAEALTRQAEDLSTLIRILGGATGVGPDGYEPTEEDLAKAQKIWDDARKETDENTSRLIDAFEYFDDGGLIPGEDEGEGSNNNGDNGWIGNNNGEFNGSTDGGFGDIGDVPMGIPEPRSMHIDVLKPNIYLYPESGQQVNVRFVKPENVTVSIPQYVAPEGWTVYAEPSGLLDYTYDFLFYEASVEKYHFQKEAGWFVPARDRLKVFRAFLGQYGFNEKETKDFVEFWDSKLEKNKNYRVYPQETAIIDKAMPMTVNPAPDSIARIWFYFEESYHPAMTAPIEVEKIKRNGFTVVEWGGMVED